MIYFLYKLKQTMRKALNPIRFWIYRRRFDLPHPDEIKVYSIKKEYLQTLARMYKSGFNLEQCSILIEQMTCPEAPVKTRADGSQYKQLWINERQFYGQKLTTERLRRLLWVIWRDQQR